MKCKNCGGELLIQNGKYTCESCKATFSVENIYENVEVYLCYMETDDSGRRTKDSIVAQEVFRKLEAAKFDVFYERISADGIVGDDLDSIRYAALQKAKAVLVLGTCKENFDMLVEKYGLLLEGKTVIPFCVDVNPGEIPKNISKIQAINYNTIGWEKDIFKGLNNLLGKKEIDASTLYSGARKKRIIITSIISMVLVVGVALALLVSIGRNNQKIEQAQNETQNEQLTPQEIYSQAVSLLDQKKYAESLGMFAQIPDHPDAAKKIKLIHAKYEGYYQKDNLSFRISFLDENNANIEVRIASDKKLLKFETSGKTDVDIIKLYYRDNHNSSGEIMAVLKNEGIHIKITDEKSKIIEKSFKFSSKTDQSVSIIEADSLLKWIDQKKTPKQIADMGYDLTSLGTTDRFAISEICRIDDTDIYLSFFSFEYNDGEISYSSSKKHLVGVTAPASVLAPFMVGKTCEPFLKENIMYRPNGIIAGGGFFIFAPIKEWTKIPDKGKYVNDNTLIGIVKKESFSNSDWENLVQTMFFRKLSDYHYFW